MSTYAVAVRSLGKRYRLRPAGARPSYNSLREAIADTFQRPFRRVRGTRSAAQDFWALRDVTFDVGHGEVIGIIGRNGAGKSTLLKILSRVTEPTTGRARVYGRVGALLEVGTGFHPELTGRENIYLNGAILGMSRADIRYRFDAIVAFAEVEQFLDEPVKRYSSGMYMRLAFSIAAHLEPDVMVVDEVLAVGDVAFQKKCLDKMGDTAREGRTVLLVSHHMPTVQALCSRALRLHQGRLEADGETSAVVGGYLDAFSSSQRTALAERTDRGGDGSVRATAIQIHALDVGTVRTSSRLRVTIHYESDRPIKHARFVVGVYDTSDAGIFVLNTDYSGGLADEIPARGTVTCVTSAINLTAGRCFVNVAVYRGTLLADHIEHAAQFDVEEEDIYGSGKIPSRDWVMCVLGQKWSHDG